MLTNSCLDTKGLVVNGDVFSCFYLIHSELHMSTYLAVHWNLLLLVVLV